MREWINIVTEGKWWDDSPTMTLYHGTTSALVDSIREHGLRHPKDSIEEYALDILARYIPRERWTDELIKDVTDHAIRPTSRTGDFGAVIYCFAEPAGAAGYARTYAAHGGEIACDVHRIAALFLAPKNLSWLEFRADEFITPRFADAKPMVVEIEVPKSWCVTAFDLARYRQDMIDKWNSGAEWTRREASTLEEFLNRVFDRREVRVTRPVPPEMIVSIEPVPPK